MTTFRPNLTGRNMMCPISPATTVSMYVFFSFLSATACQTPWNKFAKEWVKEEWKVFVLSDNTVTHSQGPREILRPQIATLVRFSHYGKVWCTAYSESSYILHTVIIFWRGAQKCCGKRRQDRKDALFPTLLSSPSQNHIKPTSPTAYYSEVIML